MFRRTRIYKHAFSQEKLTLIELSGLLGSSHETPPSPAGSGCTWQGRSFRINVRCKEMATSKTPFEIIGEGKGPPCLTLRIFFRILGENRLRCF